jgi:putative tryptophan/tyrosine transport system substrate-binding protein
LLDLEQAMRRREFITLLTGAAVWPLAARAQQKTIPIVGFINSASPKPYAPNLKGFLQGLKDAGYIEGRNVLIEYRWAEGQYDRLPAMAAELVHRDVSVIVANTPAAPIVKAATATIPVVFLTGEDPVGSGLVTSLNRPEGNVTGIAVTGPVLLGKQLGVLHQLVPAATSISVLVNPHNPVSEPSIEGAQEAARALGRQVRVLNASTEAEIDKAFASLARADGLVVAPDSVFIARRDQLVALAARGGVLTIYPFREFTSAGGLMSYGASLPERFRQAGIYAGKILQGAKPGDLPVQQPTKYELVINLKATRNLGLELPPSVLALADEVIE